MRKSKQEMINNVQRETFVPIIKSKIVGVSTLDYTLENGTRAIRYHDTDVITFRPDRTIKLDSGGWRTATTKKRMNEYLYDYGYQVTQRDFEWYIIHSKGEFKFKDNIILRTE